MRAYFLIGLIIIFFSCQNRLRQPEKLNNTKSDTSLPDTIIEKGVMEKPRENPSGYIYKSDIVRIIGDTTIDKKKIYYSEVKFEPIIYFDDFRIDTIYVGQKSTIDYNSNKTAKRFKTVITDFYSRSMINFAGFYSLVWWGCGLPCQQSALIDWRDGKVYDGPDASLGFDFRKDSRMLITNPPDSTGFYPDCTYCQPQLWIWNETKKIFREIKRKN